MAKKKKPEKCIDCGLDMELTNNGKRWTCSHCGHYQAVERGTDVRVRYGYYDSSIGILASDDFKGGRFTQS